jgi:PAS domain S-box-containing protein
VVNRIDSTAPLDPRSRLVVDTAAAVATMIAAAALGGWLTESPWLHRGLPSYPPLPPNAALGLLGAALGLVGVGRARRGLILFGAILVLLAGASGVLEHIWSLSLGVEQLFPPTMDLPDGGRMSVASAVILVLAGLALAPLAAPRPRRLGTVVAGTLGSAIIALSTAMLFVYTTDVLSSLRDSTLIGLPVHGAVAFAGVGLGLLTVAWRRDPAPAMPPAWMPFSAGAATLITALGVWWALTLEEQTRAANLLQTQANVAEHELLGRIDGSVKLLRQLSAAGVSTADARAGLDTTAQRLMSEEPAFVAVAWFDSLSDSARGRVELRSPWQPDSGESRNLLTANGTQMRELASGTLPAVLFGPRVSAQRPWILLAARCGATPPTPGCSSGLAAGVLRADALLRVPLALALPGYDVAIHGGGSLLYQSTDSGRPSDPRGLAEVTSYGVPWQVQVWPAKPMTALFHSDLPEVVMGMGIIVSVLLTVTLRLVRTSFRAARLAERERLALALESGRDGLWDVNALTGESSRSPGLWEGLGYDPASIDPEEGAARWMALIHPDERERVEFALQQHLFGRTPFYESEYRVRARDGEWHWIVERGRVVERDPEGSPVRLLGVCADVTERMKADEALAASERRFRAVFDSGFQFQSLLDLDGRLLEANRTSLEFGGVDIEDVRGEYFWETPWWRGDATRQARLQHACVKAAQGETVLYQEAVQGDADRKALIDFSLKPIQDAEGRVLQILAEGRDITERKRAEDAMREIDTLSTMGRLAARVAHEINNPLAGIQNSFLLVKDAVPESHPHHAYVGAIEREIGRIAAVTRQLYETYRPTSDGAAPAPVPVVISDAVRMLEQVNRRSKVRIEVDAGEAPTVVPIPSALLRQAVYNLVQNAVEASPPGAAVEVRAWRDQRTFWLSVRDFGPGVPAHLRDKIFEPFVSTKNGIKTGGMGLGLSLVRRSVQAVGGRIEIHDPEGGGAEFRIQLPLAS